MTFNIPAKAYNVHVLYTKKHKLSRLVWTMDAKDLPFKSSYDEHEFVRWLDGKLKITAINTLDENQKMVTLEKAN